VDVYNEGALIFPAVKVQEDYENIDDIIRLCRMRIRIPDQWYGDYLAMVGAARIGEREILAIADEFGWDTLHAFTEMWFDYSEKRMIEAIRRIPKSETRADSTHDPVPGTPPEGIVVRVGLKVDPDAAKIDVDLRDNPDTMPCGLNLSEACARTAAMIGIFNSIDEMVPTNAGSFRRIQIHIRKGSIVGGGQHPTSMSVATTNLADRVTNSVQIAFSRIKEGLGLAECGPILPASMGVISGRDPRRDNQAFVNQLFLLFTGGAGSAWNDSWITICHAGNSGMSYIDSIELDELHFPIIIKGRGLLKDTEGAGRTIGAPSGYCEFGPVEGNALDVAWVADGAVNPAKGTLGGLDGAPIRNYRRRADGELEELSPCAMIVLQPGEMVVSYTAGGGGYGPPWTRAVDHVLKDVNEGHVSLQRAFETYGVVVDQEGRLDEAATRMRRIELSKKNQPGDE